MFVPELGLVSQTPRCRDKVRTRSRDVWKVGSSKLPQSASRRTPVAMVKHVTFTDDQVGGMWNKGKKGVLYPRTKFLYSDANSMRRWIGPYHVIPAGPEGMPPGTTLTQSDKPFSLSISNLEEFSADVSNKEANTKGRMNERNKEGSQTLFLGGARVLACAVQYT